MITPAALHAYADACEAGQTTAQAYRAAGVSRRDGQRIGAALRSAGWSPPRRLPERPGRKPGSALGRLDDYRFLLAERETPRAAAARLGVSHRTIQRYDAALRSQQALSASTATTSRRSAA